MEYLTLLPLIKQIAPHQTFLAFYYTFEGCLISIKNLKSFCNAFDLDYSLINNK